jgi:hypothetical protein
LVLLVVKNIQLLKKKHKKHQHKHSKSSHDTSSATEKPASVETYNTGTTKKFIKSDGSSLRNHFGYPWDESPYAGGS